MSSAETAAQDQSPDTSSPKSHATASGDGSADDSTPSVNPPSVNPPRTDSQISPPKTDKPRPHVCANCGRGFARLEHLKRHERSHTKEKPFECPECTRCFARRDLLLRHQQKLHFAQNPARAARGGARRESMSGVSTASGRVRKNSVANPSAGNPAAVGVGGPRPRANTMGHLDLESMGVRERPILASVNERGRSTVTGLPGAGKLEYRGMSSAAGNHGPIHALPRLDTNGVKDFDSALHTAPPYAGPDPFTDGLFATPITGSTVNPAQLHFAGMTESPLSPYPNMNVGGDQSFEGDDFSWLQGWNNSQIMAGNEFAVDESSPSVLDSNGLLPPADMNIDLQAFAFGGNMNNVTTWPPQDPMMQPLVTPTVFHLDALGNGLPNLDSSMPTLSPQHLQESVAQDSFFNGTLPQNPTNGMHSHRQSLPPQSMSNFDSDSPSMASSITGSARQSSVTSVSTSSITDATRQALMISLAQPSVFGHNPRKYSQPSIPSPLSPSGTLKSNTNLPATSDLQRYVSAYIQSFHPHMPFLHIPTLSFDSTDYTSNIRPASTQAAFGHNGMIGGGGCLILAMAAIGALYEYEHAASKELFEAAKKMIQLYLEERRKADMSAAVNGQHNASGAGSPNTPLWLVQAMLLNVVYGHHCGDRQASEIASTHCAALVSLARAAELAQPSPGNNADDDGCSPGGQQSHTPHSSAHQAWLSWKEAEERKRTLYAVFTLSSLLVIAYNHAPAIMNSEIQLDLPCDEELWAAESSAEWVNRGGMQVAEHGTMSFEAALGRLLAAHQHNHIGLTSSAHTHAGGLAHGGNPLDVRPSTFGCLVLINALHNYIWETRNRHANRNWTPQETESMFAHIEPALNAWQAAWRANEQHHLQRPNPFGLGPLSADCIPLLDVAFVRLFINPGRSKEAFWQRDFDAMSGEFARSAEVMHNGAAASPAGSGASPGNDTDASSQTRQGLRRPSQVLTNGQGSKRERQLRRAAFYAADALAIACKLMLTYADICSHELPIQAGICFFDCSQVLAEWAATVQDRVGRYLGVLGRESIDYTQVPAIMLLEAEDIDLLTKLEHICTLMEDKLVHYAQAYGTDGAMLISASGGDRIAQLVGLGHAAKVLRVTALMLEKGAVWPVTHVMANALTVHATHVARRAEVFAPHLQ